MTLAAVVLAAGQGTRLKSALPKVLHPLAGHPMAHYALATAQAVTGAHWNGLLFFGIVHQER